MQVFKHHIYTYLFLVLERVAEIMRSGIPTPPSTCCIILIAHQLNCRLLTYSIKYTDELSLSKYKHNLTKSYQAPTKLMLELYMLGYDVLYFFLNLLSC